MAKVDKYLEELAEFDFLEAIQKVNSYMYEILEGQQAKSGGGKVTSNILNIVKKCTDYVNLRLVKVHADYVSTQTKLKTMVTDSKAYDALITRRLGASASDSMSEYRKVERVTRPKPTRIDTGFSVLLTPSEGTVDDIRGELRRFSKDDDDFPKLSDVVATKNGQLVLKVKSKQESVNLVKKMEALGEKVKITAPQRRRSRLLLLSVDPDIDEAMVLDSVKEVMVSEGIDRDREVDVVRKINTRFGKVNWVLDVDMEVFRTLLGRKRICMDFNRYRIVEFLQIMRCFKCQGYGHMSSRCQGDQKCSKCAGDHRLSECTVDTELCVNCVKNEDVDTNTGHRADSPDCPVFRVYRADLMASRL